MSANKPFSRRNFLKIAGMTALGGALASCAPQAAATTAPAAANTAAPQVTEPTTAPPAAATKPVEIVHWSWLSASDGEVWQKMIDNFNADDANKSAGVTVKMTVLPDTEYATKVLAATATGQAPDFGWGTGGQQVNWIKQGVVVPMDDIVPVVGLDLTDFTTSSINFSRYPSFGNKLYMVPMDAMTLCMEINTDHAKAANLDITKPPKTGDELLTWAKAMTKSDGGKITQSGFLMTGSGLQPTVVWGIVASQMGFKRVSDDLKTSCLNPEAGKTAMQWMVDLFDKDKVSTRDVTDRYTAFGVGQGSMFWTGPWTINGYVKSGLNFISVPVPKVGDHQDTYYELGGLEMYTQTDTGRYNATLKGIKWLSDNSFLWTTVGRGGAARKSILARPDYQSAGPDWTKRGAFIESLDFATLTAGVPVVESNELNFYNGGSFLSNTLAAVLAGQKNIDDAMSEIKVKWDGFLAEG